MRKKHRYLSVKQGRKLREEYLAGETIAHLARQYHVSYVTALNIVHCRGRWECLKEDSSDR